LAPPPTSSASVGPRFAAACQRLAHKGFDNFDSRRQSSPHLAGAVNQESPLLLPRPAIAQLAASSHARSAGW